MQKVTAVFDIGKTNKKFFLFDFNFKEVYREYTKFDEIVDEDGFPCENLLALHTWLKEVFDRILKAESYDIIAINFSSYGASLVHIDVNGNVLTPLYNYTKPMDQYVLDDFNQKYGLGREFTKRTGCVSEGMLNSGMQIYWLKKTKPEIYSKIKYSLHLPQYISYIFTGFPLSEYTSIGCHTGLWDYQKKDYHDWVYEERINEILAPIVSTETSINMKYNGKPIKIGVGVHDSSAALLLYIRSVKKKFILVSTGTWSIALNPFVKSNLSDSNIDNECINYMRLDGSAVKASRLFLGNEYKLQVQFLLDRYKVAENYHKSVKFNHAIFEEISFDFKPMFIWKSLKNNSPLSLSTMSHNTFEKAYHQLMLELVLLQVESIKTTIGENKIHRIYIDGGFSDNDLYVSLLSHYLRGMKIHTTDSSLGSALGAALCISDLKLNSKFMKETYSLKKHVPFISKIN